MVDRAVPRQKRSLPLYLIPLIIGMGGILFAHQLPNPVLRGIVLLISVSAPMFAVGNLLARLRSRGYERYILIVGVIMLSLGAVVTLLEFSEADGTGPFGLSEFASDFSRWAGMLGLLLGLSLVLFIIGRREEAVEELAQHFRNLAEHMSEGFVLADPDGTIRLVNKSFLRMTGLKEHDVIGRSSMVLAQQFKLDPMLPHIEKRAKGLASEYRLTWNVNGEERFLWVSGTPIFSARGELAGVLATLRDVTEQTRLSERLERYTAGLQKLVEDQTQRLRHSEERLRHLLVYMNEGFLTIDSAFHVRFANERIRQMLQVGADEMRGRSVFDFVAPTGRGRLLELLQRAASAQGGPAQEELQLMRASGVPVSVVVAAAPIRDPEDQGPRFSLVLTDVSDLKYMQEQLRIRARELESANEELRLLDKAKDSFLSNVSHELRTPLSTIRGYLEMLQSTSHGAGGVQEKAYNVMGRNADRLGKLIEEMLEFSRMQIRGMQLNIRLFNLPAAVHECADSFQPQALDKAIRLSVDLPDALPPVWADRERLVQVLTILLSNAVKFTEEEGAIEIAVSRRDERTAAISVRDNGIGIDPAYHGRIFDKFYQVDSSLARQYQGTGIGLSLAKSIAEAHGGTIELDSALGVGSSFTIVLPEAFFVLDALEDSDASLANLSCFVVAAFPEERDALVEAVENTGADVSAYGNGFEAVRAAAELGPDIVLADAHMPEMSGLELMGRLRDVPTMSETPVVLLSGRTNEQAMEAEAQLRGALVLHKPFTGRHLVAMVDAAISGLGIQAEEGMPEAVAQRPESLRALVVEPDPDLLEWVETALQTRRIACYGAASMGQAVELAEGNPVDAVFVDVESLDGSVAEAVGLFHQASKTRHVPVYLLTDLPFPPDDAAGAAGTLRKPFAIDDMAAFVRSGAAR